MIPEMSNYKKVGLKQKLIMGALCVIVDIITIIAIVMTVYMQRGYSLDVGSVSPRRFDAETTFENKYATEKLKEEAKENVLPVYMFDSEAQNESLEKLNDFFGLIENYKKAKSQSPYLLSKIVFDSMNSEDKSKNGFTLSEEQLIVIDSMSDSDYERFKSSVENIYSILMQREIKTENDVPIFIQDCMDEYFVDFTQKQYSFASYILNSVITPNCVVDTEATEVARNQKADAVEPVMILKNQKIIDEGEIIDEETLSILKGMGYVNTNNAIFDNIPQILGIAILVTVIFICELFLLRKYLFDICNPKGILVIFTLYMCLIVSSVFLKDFHYTVTPILIFTLLTSLMINIRTAVSLNVAVTAVCCFMYSGNVEFMIYFIAMGTIIAATAKYYVERTQLMYSIAAVIFFSLFIMAGITLMNDTYWKDDMLKNLLYAFFTTGFSYIIALGVLPVFESIFGIVTNVKLLELINPNRELLRKLLIEAPGTYHHSLIVANLAEAACSNIKANAVLARVGAYYHDIGKLKNPYYFTENIIGKNPHDDFEPQVSANIIMNHIKDGLELADKYKLPEVVKKIIRQHHGTSSVRFFYQKAKDMYGNENVKKSDYCYKYELPDTKEAAVVMIADICEASVRSMLTTGKSMEEIESFISKVISDKIDEHQFTSCDLSFKELDIIINSFMEVFKGMYHKRIQYPDDKKTDEENKKEE